MGSKPMPQHDTFEQFMEAEWRRLQKHACGTLAQALERVMNLG